MPLMALRRLQPKEAKAKAGRNCPGTPKDGLEKRDPAEH